MVVPTKALVTLTTPDFWDTSERIFFSVSSAYSSVTGPHRIRIWRAEPCRVTSTTGAQVNRWRSSSRDARIFPTQLAFHDHFLTLVLDSNNPRLALFDDDPERFLKKSNAIH